LGLTAKKTEVSTWYLHGDADFVAFSENHGMYGIAENTILMVRFLVEMKYCYYAIKSQKMFTSDTSGHERSLGS